MHFKFAVCLTSYFTFLLCGCASSPERIKSSPSEAVERDAQRLEANEIHSFNGRNLAADPAAAPNRLLTSESSTRPAFIEQLLQFQADFDRSENNPTRTVKVLHRQVDEKATHAAVLKASGCKVEVIVLSALDPFTQQLGGLQIRLYQPRLPKSSTQVASLVHKVLILPPTGGENPLDLAYADAFCAKGMEAAVLERWDGDTNNEIDLDLHDLGALRSLAAVRHAVEFLNPQQPQELGILGTSVGALTAILAAGYEPRISSAVFIAGGVGIDQIIPLSDERNLTRLKYERIARFQFSDEKEYRTVISRHLTIEPGQALSNTGLKAAWIVIAEKDTTVPTATQEALKDKLIQLLGAEHVHVQSEPGNHVATIKKTFEHVVPMSNFLNWSTLMCADGQTTHCNGAK